MKKSRFKTPESSALNERLIDAFADETTLRYEKLDVETSFGRTRVLAARRHEKHLKPILFVPGARTCGIFFDLHDNLHLLGENYRIYLLDVVGQPSLSDGNCPALKNDAYGRWLEEVCVRIDFEKGVCVGASFGGLLIFKLAAVAPERIEKAVMMNPIGLSSITLNPLNLFYTMLPVIFPNRKTVEKFLDQIVFTPTETIAPDKRERFVDYIENTVRNFEFNGDYPGRLDDAQIEKLTAETHLILGDADGLIPYRNTIRRAEKLLPELKTISVLPQHGHGIELARGAILKLSEILSAGE